MLMSFCEYLVVNNCSVSMIANYLSAIKASFVLYNMSYSLLDHPRIKYFQKSMRINRPLAVTSHDVIDLAMLEQISKTSDQLNFPEVFRAIFLTGQRLTKIVFGEFICGNKVFHFKTAIILR